MLIILKLLIFSDIHNDWKTLERLLSVEADYYIAAGDQVTWARGIERCGEILEHARRQGLRAARQPRIGRPDGRACARATACTISTSAICRSAAGTSPGSATPAPRRSTRPASTASRRWPSACSGSPTLDPLVLICHARPTARRSTGSAPACTPGRARCAISSSTTSPSTSSAATSTRPRASPSRSGKTRARNVGKQGYLLELD